MIYSKSNSAVKVRRKNGVYNTQKLWFYKGNSWRYRQLFLYSIAVLR